MDELMKILTETCTVIDFEHETELIYDGIME